MNRLDDTGTWMRIGAKQGAKWGFLLALAYTLWILWEGTSTNLSTEFIQQGSDSFAPRGFISQTLEDLPTLLLIIPVILLAGGLVGGIPALLIGGVSGGILGGVLSHSSIRPSAKARFLTSLLFGLSAALIANLSASSTPPDAWDYGRPDSGSLHWQFIGLPSIVYIGVCLILSQQLPLWVERAHAKESPVEPLPSLSN